MLKDLCDKLDALAKSVEELTKGEKLEKPPVSEAQRKAMHAAAAGKSTLDIPKSVGKKFADADKGGKLPEKAKKGETLDGEEELLKPKDKAEKIDLSARAKGTKEKEAPDLGQYWKQPLNTPASKTPTAASIDYSQGAKNPVVTPRAPKAPNAASTPKPKTALDEIKERQKMNKAEYMGKITSEQLTKSIRARHSDQEISLMLNAAVNEGKLHRNVMLEWQNFKTINPIVVGLVDEE